MTNQDKQMGESIALLYDFLASLTSAEQVRAFLEDACTFREIEQIAQRMECAGYLLAGKTYQEVIAKTDASSATLSRISRCIRHGSGGYAEHLSAFLSGKGLLPGMEETT